jgi:hypothetical protein
MNIFLTRRARQYAENVKEEDRKTGKEVQQMHIIQHAS